MTPDAAESPADLVRRIVAGDRGAEAELVARYGEGLRFLLRRWTRDPAAADDLYQESLRLAIEKIRQGELRQPDRLLGFLRGLAHNLAIQLYRRSGERPELRADVEAVKELPARGPGQLGDLLRRERIELARKVLAELPTARDREVLSRYYLAEESTERICSDLGLSPDHLYRVLHRARGRYRSLYEEKSSPAGRHDAARA